MRKPSDQKYCSWCGADISYEDLRSVCGRCGYTDYLIPRPTCSLILAKGSKVLLTKRAIEPRKGAFDLPGGFMDMNDISIEEATYREMREELNLDKSMVTQLQYVGSGATMYPWEDVELRTISFCFSCRLIDGNENLIDLDLTENSDIRWVVAEDLSDIDFAWDIDRRMLTRYFEEA